MSKPMPSLDGLIQAKGTARPDVMQQRGASSVRTEEVLPAPPPIASPPLVPVSEPRAKSLTLRLSESQYQRLRRFAFERGQSHQDVIEHALMGHLDRQSKD